MSAGTADLAPDCVAPGPAVWPQAARSGETSAVRTTARRVADAGIWVPSSVQRTAAGPRGAGAPGAVSGGLHLPFFGALGEEGVDLVLRLAQALADADFAVEGAGPGRVHLLEGEV